MVSLGTRITTTMREKIMPFVVDTILNSNVMFTHFVSKAKKAPWTGNQMSFPIKYRKNSTGTSFAGFDLLSTSATTNRVKMTFDPAFYQITSSLPLDEISVARASGSGESIINLVEVTLTSDVEDMADDLGTIFYADGTGNGGKDPLGLGAIVDDGTSVPTYGGLSRATYPSIDATVTASGGSLSLAKMATLDNNVSSGNIKADLGFTDEATWALYQQLLQPQERYSKTAADVKAGLVGGTGYSELLYNAFEILKDEKCTSGTLFFIREETIKWYAVPVDMAEPVKFMPDLIKDSQYDTAEVQGLGFSWTDWIKPTNQAAMISHTWFGGQLIGRNPKRTGRLTGITGV